MTDCAILDASWLLELYQVPGDSKKARHKGVLLQAEAAARGRMLVTVPVLFEVANHIVHVRNGHHRRRLIKQYTEHLNTSLKNAIPWTVVRPSRDDILLRTEDLIELANRFVEASGTGYSLADISIVDLARRLQKRKQTVQILAFDKQLEAYSG